jgi:hypothetical protein
MMERSFGLLSSGKAKCCLQRVQTLANEDLLPILVMSINAVDRDTVELRHQLESSLSCCSLTL